MKLIYITNSRIPTEKAHGYQICKMCEAFIENNIELKLIIPRRFNEIKQDVFQYYDIKNKFDIIKIPCLDFSQFGIMGFWIQTLSFLLFSKIYLFFINYDILYTRDKFLGLFYKNYILELHELPKNINNVILYLLKKAKKLIVLTSYLKIDLINRGILENRIIVSADAVDLKDFDISKDKNEIRKILKLPKDKKIILYTGSFYLYDWKGVDLFIESSKYFDNNYLFILIGGNNNEIVEMKNKYKNYSNILFLEKKEHKYIPLFLKAADILVLPNKKGNKTSEFYTSPLKLFEYMASGTPTVASDLPSIKEILNDNNSILFSANNINSLVDSIKKIIDNVGFAEKISLEAKKNVYINTWNLRVKNIINFINKKNE
ncbi:MAG: glycosyltransferase [Patescibacteria group bacterium]|nr:glycosyltransferase [Patescibacteria group bacterium]MDD4304269.1 glycosyltransferase [Patescibacteria group bacterium]MDD4695323.1 glycosyltransferase [Patescibacteria group bacterium]